MPESVTEAGEGEAGFGGDALVGSGDAEVGFCDGADDGSRDDDGAGKRGISPGTGTEGTEGSGDSVRSGAGVPVNGADATDEGIWLR
jgi:hypothetical protein